MEYKRNKGFGLIEVLVTLLLTTVGILGMVALQGKGIRYTQDAINRNNAASLANDLVEIMRQYPDEFWVHGTQHYERLATSNALFNGSGGLVITAESCPTGTPQTLSQQAACWLQRVENTLPGAATAAVKSNFRICPSFTLQNGAIACAGANFEGSTIGIQLAWQVRAGECMDGNSESTVCIYHTRIEL